MMIDDKTIRIKQLITANSDLAVFFNSIPETDYYNLIRYVHSQSVNNDHMLMTYITIAKTMYQNKHVR